MRTILSPGRTPYINYALILINAIIFFVAYGPHEEILFGRLAIVPVHHWAKQLMLIPAQPRIYQFLSYAFLHGSFGHIIGNMYFLYLFGNNVNDKIGHIGYLVFYLAGGI